MKKKIFAISDVHGHFNEMIESLTKAGFDETNQNHLLVICGDYFERGPKSKEIYDYIQKLSSKNKIVAILGNHEYFMQEFLTGPVSNFNYKYNGFGKTLDSFLEQDDSFKTFVEENKKSFKSDMNNLWNAYTSIARNKINKDYPEMINWLNNLPPYFETKNYIFTHGAINGTCKDWRNPPEGWRDLTWAKPQDFMHKISNTDKKVVVGHINAGLIRKLFYNGPETDNSTLVRHDGKVIALDGCTILSKKINVLVIEDELI